MVHVRGHPQKKFQRKTIDQEMVVWTNEKDRVEKDIKEFEARGLSRLASDQRMFKARINRYLTRLKKIRNELD